jgi:hypothetical protein
MKKILLLILILAGTIVAFLLSKNVPEVKVSVAEKITKKDPLLQNLKEQRQKIKNPSGIPVSIVAQDSDAECRNASEYFQTHSIEDNLIDIKARKWVPPKNCFGKESAAENLLTLIHGIRGACENYQRTQNDADQKSCKSELFIWQIEVDAKRLKGRNDFKNMSAPEIVALYLQNLLSMSRNNDVNKLMMTLADELTGRFPDSLAAAKSGLMAAMMNDDQVVESAQNVMRLDPNDFEVQTALTFYSGAKENDLAQLQDIVQQFEKTSPHSPATEVGEAYLAHRQGDDQAAINYLKLAAQNSEEPYKSRIQSFIQGLREKKEKPFTAQVGFSYEDFLEN